MADGFQTGVLCKASVLPHRWNAPLHGLGRPQPAAGPGIRHVNGAGVGLGARLMIGAQADTTGLIMLANPTHYTGDFVLARPQFQGIWHMH